MSDYSKVKDFLSKTPSSVEEAKNQESVERVITLFRENKLKINPIQGNYDFEHLSKIHKYLFDGLYDHAGQLRPQTQEWGKQNQQDPSLYSEFARADESIEIIQNNSDFLKENNYLKNLNRDDFIYEFTICYAEVNSAHPFVEGNGRATRVMFQQLAEQAGYHFDISRVDKVEWDRASALSGRHFILYEDETGGFVGEEQEIDIEPLLELMDQSISELELELKTKDS